MHRSNIAEIDSLTPQKPVSQPTEMTLTQKEKETMKFIRSKFAVLTILCLMLSALTAHALSDGENRSVKIINEASTPIYHLYVSNVDENSWGPDQLGLFESIDYNRYRLFNMDDGTGHCLFDLKVVLKDGRYAVHHNFNVCTEGSWTVQD
jgi:hypothetical protein